MQEEANVRKLVVQSLSFDCVQCDHVGGCMSLLFLCHFCFLFLVLTKHHVQEDLEPNQNAVHAPSLPFWTQMGDCQREVTLWDHSTGKWRQFWHHPLTSPLWSCCEE